jgi:hypothetical protein
VPTRYLVFGDERSRAREELVGGYLLKMAGAVLGKRGAAKAVSLWTLLFPEAGEADRPDLPAGLVGRLPAELAEVFGDLDEGLQSAALGYRWRLLKCPEMVAPLRRVCERAPEDRRDLRTVALRRLYELDPAAGRTLILEELRRPQPRAGIAALGLLPEKTLPEFDEVLAANLEKARTPGDQESICPLIERYATGAILRRVRAVFERSRVRWDATVQAALLAYFLRAEPAAGSEVLAAALADRREGQLPSYRELLSEVAGRRPCPEVEKLAVGALDDPDPEVAASAARALQACGSAPAEAALWKRLEKWHGQWQARAAELDPDRYAPGTMPDELSNQGWLARCLAMALARGAGWLADKPKLERIRKLCLDPGDARQIGQLAGIWDDSLPLRCMPDFDGAVSFEIAQYECATPAAARTKLKQFPKGTVFRWDAPSDGPLAAAARKALDDLKPFLEERGLRLEGMPQPPGRSDRETPEP